MKSHSLVSVSNTVGKKWLNYPYPKQYSTRILHIWFHGVKPTSVYLPTCGRICESFVRAEHSRVRVDPNLSIRKSRTFSIQDTSRNAGLNSGLHENQTQVYTRGKTMMKNRAYRYLVYKCKFAGRTTGTRSEYTRISLKVPMKSADHHQEAKLRSRFRVVWREQITGYHIRSLTQRPAIGSQGYSVYFIPIWRAWTNSKRFHTKSTLLSDLKSIFLTSRTMWG